MECYFRLLEILAAYNALRLGFFIQTRDSIRRNQSNTFIFLRSLSHLENEALGKDSLDKRQLTDGMLRHILQPTF
ncbi:hypothetical protein SAMN05444507_112183 [Pseudomonas syringae]|nr:hypothetical protein SAMN05444507_112183 [Pseudomonas syringae]